MDEDEKNEKKEWKGVSFPVEFLEEIEKVIKEPYVKANYAIRSVPDFLRRGGVELLQKLKKEIEENI